jgi:hypothetical protein
LTLSQTAGNRIRGNEIGLLAPGRGAVGLFVTNATDNEIGGPALIHGNTVFSNSTNGIVISGPASAGNSLFNNFIGRDRNGVIKANRGDGVLLAAGAHDNFIGGQAVDDTKPLFAMIVPAGNVIANNDGVGVHVMGTNTTGNRILNNSITGNFQQGILHENGGNHDQSPPVFLAFDGTTISGMVTNLADTPPGSLIQVFTDPDRVDPEGDAYFGEGLVRSNGTWSAKVVGKMRHPVLTMTATHAVDGSTSEFGWNVTVTNLIHFAVARTDAATSGSVGAGASNASVLHLSLSAVNADVRVDSIAFDAVGSLPDSSAITGARLYADTDGDGAVTAADPLLAGPVTFGADDGRITFANMSPVIEANSTQQWVVAYSLAPGAPVGATFQLILTNAAAVVAEYLNPIGLDAVPEGSFAIQSALFTVTAQQAGQTFAAWAAGIFTAAQLADPNVSGFTADPDNDGLINILEYAFNLNPLAADRNTLPTADRGAPFGSLVRAFDPVSQSNQDFLEVTFLRRKEPMDLIYSIEHSTDLQNWSDAFAAPAVLAISAQQDVGPPGTLERVTYRGTQPVGSNARRFIRVRVQQKL